MAGALAFDENARVDPGYVPWVRSRADADGFFAFETSHRRKDGITFPVEVRFRPFLHDGRSFALCLVRDLTDRKRAEAERERLQQLQDDLTHINRVTTMGELTASLAHEINQPIAGAVTSANACMRWLAADGPRPEEARDSASRVVRDANRAAEIIRRIRLLFKKGAPQYDLLDVNDVVDEIVVLLRAEATRSRVSIRTDLAPELPQVRGDRVQLQQVLMNLAMNGIDAMKEVVGRRELTLASRLDAEDRVLVAVSDTGTGLPPEAGQIFDAFFTTKPQGTGMGLAISRRIIESHGPPAWRRGTRPRIARECTDRLSPTRGKGRMSEFCRLALLPLHRSELRDD